MADTTSATAPKPDSAESPNQLITALAIVAALAVLATAILIIGYLANQFAAALTVVSAISGGLLTALNAPSGIGRVIAAAKSPPPPAPTEG